MLRHKLPLIEVGYQVFLPDRVEECGAVREVAPAGRPQLVIYVENAGEFIVPLEAVGKVVEQKVVLDPAKLDEQLLAAIGHAHDKELPGL